ncbi:MAG: 4Fe-4S dicluster domain-containing protein [Desulfobacterales bacterium]|nr:4Fe-4S dicluster domain-containing protein [Desulfobacterales bacterium]MDD4073238.1 4Fe-4S dicluster domain-containing protein [Desulfobacterales bacterium]MDD4394033.1 4Fe-4S dicluster domain-containing protein [Desulfobacterales bacterium]
MQNVLLLQPEKCIDCRSCQLACTLKHYGNFSLAKSRIEVLSSPMKFSVPLTCLQCDDPACAKVCVVDALVRNPETGLVEYNAEKCIGCRMCVTACPFGNISYDRALKTVIKCDTCHGDPECAKFCPTGAIQWIKADLETLDRKKAMSAKFEQVFGKEA